jgi:CheY-like chemotaxis protein
MGQRILLFEADQGFAHEVRQKFEALGVTVDVANDGDQGLDIAAAHRPDLILLTIELPRMNGFLVCKKIKKLDNLASVPLLIMSSEATEDVFEQHKKLRTRAEDYIHKPIGFADLLERTKRFMEISSNGGAAHDSEPPLELVEEDSEVILVADDGDDTDVTAEPEAAEVGDDELDAVVAPVAPSASMASMALPAMQPQARVSMPMPQASLSPRPVVSQSPARSAGFDPITAVSAMEADGGRGQEEARKLQARVAELEAELAQAERRAADTEQEAQAAKLRASNAEKSLSEASKKGGASSRELLDLREQLNRKDRELLSLRDQVTARDRQLVEASDRSLVLEREAADLGDTHGDLQRELEKLRESNGTLLADKEAGRKRFEDAKARLERSEVRARELGDEVAGIKATHGRELEALSARYAETAGAADVAHSRAMEQLRAETAAQLEALRRAQGEELAELRDGQTLALTAAREQAEQQKHAARAELRAELDMQAQQRLSEAQAKHEAIVSQALAAHENELASLRRGLQDKHEAEQRAQSDKSQQELARVGRAIAELETKIQILQDQLEEAESGRNEVSTRLAKTTAERDAKMELTEELQAQLSRMATLRGEEEQVIDRVRKALAIGLSLLEEHKKGGN